jgi:hypothetical protein
VKILHFQTHPKNKHWWFDLSKYIYIYHIIYNIYIPFNCRYYPLVI